MTILLKRIFLLGLCCSFSWIGISQQTNPAAYDCPTSSYRNAELFQQYFLASQLDSAELVMTDWLDKCELREVTLRATLLLQMEKGNFNEKNVPDNFLDLLIEFIERDTITGINRKMWYEYNRPYYCYIPIGEKFDQFTCKQFQVLADQQTGLAALISGVYGGAHPVLFEELQKKNYATTKLGQQYNAYVQRYSNQLEANFAIFAGVWIPLNSNQPLGVHPELGFQLGGKKGKWKYDLSIAFRFLKAESFYLAKREETALLESTNHYFGGFVGFDVGYEVWKLKRNEIQFFTGIAYDGFDALQSEGELNGQSVGSYNLNMGWTYRHYLKRGKYIGLMLKYNVVDYTLNNVVDFNVQPLTVSLVFGVQKNESARRRLAAIRYHSD
ncbi:MAG: hypothetical protein AB8G15_23200 [Saprospiraceae bacterium]